MSECRSRRSIEAIGSTQLRVCLCLCRVESQSATERMLSTDHNICNELRNTRANRNGSDLASNFPQPYLVAALLYYHSCLSVAPARPSFHSGEC